MEKNYIWFRNMIIFLVNHWRPVNSSQRLKPPALLFPESDREFLHVDSRGHTVCQVQPAKHLRRLCIRCMIFLLIFVGIFKISSPTVPRKAL